MTTMAIVPRRLVVYLSILSLASLLVGFVYYYGVHFFKSQNSSNQLSTSYEADVIAFKRVRILCWVMTNVMAHESRAKAINQTWGKRCDKLLFLSDWEEENTEFSTIGLEEFRKNAEKNQSWIRTRTALKYIHQHHFEDADWFLKANDENFVVLENLRYLLKTQDPEDPIYFGCQSLNGSMFGDAGYVLSKEALRRVVEDGLPNSDTCAGDNITADASVDTDTELGSCLKNLRVEAGDSLDKFGRHRFLPFALEVHLTASHADVLKFRELGFVQKMGYDCCSDTAVSFHKLTGPEMLVFEYLIYVLEPYGIDPSKSYEPESNVDFATTVKTETVPIDHRRQQQLEHRRFKR